MKGEQRVQLSHFRCAPYTSLRVTERITDNYNQNCPYCCKQCKADEYHVIMVCEYFRDSRVKLLPDLYYSYPIMVKFDQLMNTVNIELLKKLSALCGIICKAYTSSTCWLSFSLLFVICTPWGNKLIKYSFIHSAFCCGPLLSVLWLVHIFVGNFLMEFLF